MAAHSNRSPSPLSSRPINPNPRNSENNPSICRSFSGNNNPLAKPSYLTNTRRFDPITPANSPSDFARRRSVEKEGAASHLRDCEEKENDEKDNMKASRMQSPAKGCKHFMAPTISAASKFTPSPRKKVLVERNDAVRTSISLSDGKAVFFSAMANAAEDLESNLADSENKKAAVLDNHPVSRPCKKVSFSDIHSDSKLSTESVITDSDSLKPGSTSMSKKDVVDGHPASRPCKHVTFSDIGDSHHSTTDSDGLRPETNSMDKDGLSSIAPLDADPSLAPYDPKTNYLSPRPQFIRYKPNPRVEMLLNKENGLDPDELMQLDDSLMAEIMSVSFSDSADEDESQTEDSKEETEVAAASADMVIGVDEEIEADSHVSDEPCSESLPVSTGPANDANSEEQIDEKKPRILSRLVCFSMILMFLIACVSISVTCSPSFDESFVKDLSLSDLSNLYQQSRVAVASARLSVGRLARHVHDISANSVSFVFKLANELRKDRKQAPIQFMNLTDMQVNPWNKEGHFPTIVASVEQYEEGKFEEELDDEMDYAFEEEDYEDVEFDEDVLDTEMDTFEEEYAKADYSDDYIGKEHDTQDDVASEEVPPVYVELAELESEKIQIQTELISNELNSEGQSAASRHQETELEAEAEVEVALERLETEQAQAGTISTEQALITSMPEMESTLAEESYLARHVVAIPSLVAGLVAVVVAALIYQHKKSNNPSSSNVVGVEPMLNKQADYGYTSTRNAHQEKELSQNWQTEVDAISEMSSSSIQMSGSYSKRAAADEVQSTERKTRKYSKRESLASSSEFSMGSPSYGSFTTYERIPIKSNANVEEEIMTPVRRSSRIRNHHQVTST